MENGAQSEVHVVVPYIGLLALTSCTLINYEIEEMSDSLQFCLFDLLYLIVVIFSFFLFFFLLLLLTVVNKGKKGNSLCQDIHFVSKRHA